MSQDTNIIAQAMQRGLLTASVFDGTRVEINQILGWLALGEDALFLDAQRIGPKGQNFQIPVATLLA